MKKIIQSPISLGFILVELYALSQYFFKPANHFINRIYIEAWTGIPLAYFILIYISFKWPDKILNHFHESFKRQGNPTNFKLFLFIGCSVYFMHLIVELLS